MILTCLTKLMKDIDHHGLLLSLEGIIEAFTEEIAPHAKILIEELITTYFHYKSNCQKEAVVSSSDQTYIEKLNMASDVPDYFYDDYDENETNLAATGCLEALFRLLDTELSLDIYIETTPKIANL